MLVTHDLGVAKAADDVVVLRDGKLVETAPRRRLIRKALKTRTRNKLLETTAKQCSRTKSRHDLGVPPGDDAGSHP